MEYCLQLIGTYCLNHYGRIRIYEACHNQLALSTTGEERRLAAYLLRLREFKSRAQSCTDS